MTFQGATALITGASAGLGAEFARQLAARGANLVLVARSESRLAAIAENLQRHSAVQVTTIRADLSQPQQIDHVSAEVKARGLHIDLLVNNAGLGVFEPVFESSPERQMQQIDVNVRALVALTYSFVPAMIEARRGGVINLASTAAFQPLAGSAIYAASKAFVLSFSEAIAYELKASGVHVLAACPGPVATEFFKEMKPELKPDQMDQPNVIVSETLRAFEKGKRVVYPGKWSNRLGTWGARLLPRNTMVSAAAKVTARLNQR